MHVRSVRLKNFKRFRDRTLDFTDPETGLPRRLILLVGNNGSGKSTVLQAIAAALGKATGRLESPRKLDWPGFNLDLVGNAWAAPYEVTLDVAFEREELETISACFNHVAGLANKDGITPPAREPQVTLTMREERVLAGDNSRCFQFRGREYAKQVLKLHIEGHGLFLKVGGVFWYTDHRTATSLTVEGENGRRLEFNEDELRRSLSNLMYFHLRVARGDYSPRSDQRDLFADLDNAYKAIFPSRGLEGAVPRSGAAEVLEEPWFYLHDRAHQYEVSEMSGGERAVFPMLFDFANLRINHSVVLIDELELHLHPPLQQSLIRALKSLGTNSQFIVTTHSDSVTDVLPTDCIYRLEN